MQEKEVIITHETPVAEIESYARIMGETLKPIYADKDYRRVFADLIDINVIMTVSEIMTRLCLPLAEMIDSRKHVYWWMQGMPAMRALMVSLPYLAPLDTRVLTDAPIIKTHSAKELEGLPNRIATDALAFFVCAVWYGATPDCKRRVLNNKATQTLEKVRRKIGIDGIISIMWMAATEYVVLGEKVFAPAWERMTSGRDERSINSLGSKHACEKGSRKRVVSSFADLSLLKEKKAC